MEKIEIEYSEKYLRRSLFFACLNLLLGIILFITGFWADWIPYVWLLIGISQLLSYSFEKGRKYNFTIDHETLTVTHIFRPSQIELSGLRQVEKAKDHLLLLWEDKKEKIQTHMISEESKQQLYLALRFYISNS